MSRSKPKAKTVEELMKKTRFKKESMECLLNMFRENATPIKNSEKMRVERLKFRDMLQEDFRMTDDILMDRVFRAFDLDGDGYISEEEWVLGFSVFLSEEVDEKTIRFVFRVYDIKDDGFITRESMFHFLKSCLVKQPTEEDPDEGTKELVELLLKKLDLDKDQKVSYKEFEASVREDKLLLESLGTCLPQPKYIKKFCTFLAAGGEKSSTSRSGQSLRSSQTKRSGQYVKA